MSFFNYSYTTNLLEHILQKNFSKVQYQFCKFAITKMYTEGMDKKILIYQACNEY